MPPAVIAVVRAWAGVGDLDKAPDVLAEGRRGLDPTLVPALIVEIAEVQGILLIEALELPPRKPPAPDEKLVEVLGMQLRQDQLQRFQVWIEDQGPTAKALGLELEAWSKRLEEGLATAIAALRGTRARTAERDEALDAAERMLSAQKAIGGPASTFEGGADPAKSGQAGLRGILALRDFGKKK